MNAPQIAVNEVVGPQGTQAPEEPDVDGTAVEPGAPPNLPMREKDHPESLHTFPLLKAFQLTYSLLRPTETMEAHHLKATGDPQPRLYISPRNWPSRVRLSQEPERGCSRLCKTGLW
jgi:hypothetical protein